jgi:hypothetical protein
LLIAAVLASLACAAAWADTAPIKAFFLLPARYWELGIGVLAWLAMPYLRPRVQQLPAWLASALSWLALAGLVLGVTLSDPAHFPFPWALLPVLSSAGMLVLLASRDDVPVARALASRPSLWVGLRSYSLYLWHWPVFVLMRWTWGFESPLSQAVAAALALILAAASYRWVESPTRGSAWARRTARPMVMAVGLGCVAMAAVLCLGMFKAHSRLSLSVTRHTAQWYPYERADLGPAPCAVQSHNQTLSFGTETTFEPQHCAGAAKARTLFVVGDSHAGAYTTLLQRYAAQTGTRITLLTKGGCGFFNLLGTNAQLTPPCAAFTAQTLAFLKTHAAAGDVLFMPGLRLDRIVDQWMIPPATMQEALKQRPHPRELAIAEALEALAPLQRQGLQLVLEAPKPMVPGPAFRCADWFNRHNPVCRLGLSVPRDDMERYRAPSLAALEALAKALPGTLLWDPLPRLCRPDRCDAFLDGQPILFDGDHLTAHANGLLYEDFVQVMRQAGLAH